MAVLLVTLLEMAFAGHCGLDVALPLQGATPLAALFAEELGAVIQVRAEDLDARARRLSCNTIWSNARTISALPGRATAFESPRDASCSTSHARKLRREWSATSWRLQRLRDNPACADEEYERVGRCRGSRAERAI